MDVKTKTTDRWSEEQLNVLWEIWLLTFPRGGFDTYNPPEQRGGPWSRCWSDGGWSWWRFLSLCVRKTCCVWSTLSTASEARGSCCSLAGYESDNTIVSVGCPACLPRTTHVLPFTQSFIWESPSSLSHVPFCPDVKVVYFLSGLCEGGNPDECQQEKPAAAPPLSGKLTRHPAPTFKTVQPIGRLWLAFSASLCEPEGRGFPVCVQTELLRAGFPGRMFLTAHFLIVLCWHNRANTGYVCTRVHLWTFITLILPITY